MLDPDLFTRRDNCENIAQEVAWAPGTVWRGAENFAFTGIRSLKRPAPNESLYRLNYSGLRNRIE